MRLQVQENEESQKKKKRKLTFEIGLKGRKRTMSPTYGEERFQITTLPLPPSRLSRGKGCRDSMGASTSPVTGSGFEATT